METWRMPLTQFGKACQEHRRRMKSVMADQAAGTGFPSSLISGIERGAQPMPKNYLEKMIGWMQLGEDDRIELALLAILNRAPKRPREKQTILEESLGRILDRLDVKQSNAETVE
jgi:hypothetical protein